jgi:hypothetical protein
MLLSLEIAKNKKLKLKKNILKFKKVSFFIKKLERDIARSSY